MIMMALVRFMPSGEDHVQVDGTQRSALQRREARAKGFGDLGAGAGSEAEGVVAV